MTTLTQFQDALIEAIYAQPSNDESLPAFAAQPGFQVYRNTVLKACIDALQANFPTVERLVGTIWLRDACSIYVRTHRPTDVRLMEYGADFPNFLEAFAPARELPYLPGVARLDRLWLDVHCAADEPPVDPASLATLDPVTLANIVLRVAPCARWQWFPDSPIYSIWRINREGGEWRNDIAWHGEGVLLTRPEGAVNWQAASAGVCAFLDACTRGWTLGRAALAACETEPALEVDRMFAQLLTSGCFAAAHAVNAP